MFTSFRQSQRMEKMCIRDRGDQYVEVKVEVPTKITRDEKELYEKIRNKKSHESPFDKFKKAFK